MKKVCTIVGAGPGISMAVARRFAREGYTVVLIARRLEKLGRFLEELQREGNGAYAYPADAADFTALSRVFREIHHQINPTDVLVYNVVGPRESSPSVLDAEKLVQDFRVNVAGALVGGPAGDSPHEKPAAGHHPLHGRRAGPGAAPQVRSIRRGQSRHSGNLSFSLAAELEPAGIT
jgi:NAD(P)-dependent dehydrogenase (short-subunit alcohol dehydrogenase family)